MIVLCCHAVANGKPGLRPETRMAIEENAAGHEQRFVDCNSNERRYHETLEQAWQAGADFVNVEHDIVIDYLVLPSFEMCPNLWCSYVYEISSGYIPGVLGCVRFRGALMQAESDAMVEAGKADTSGVVAKAWYRTDVRLDRILRDRGYMPCVHGRVSHLNETSKLADPDGAYIEFLERQFLPGVAR